jgi:hypothetical protein
MEVLSRAGIDDGHRGGDGQSRRRADGCGRAGRDLDDPVTDADP